MNAKTKTIKMLLYSGSINGVINISNSAWGSGRMYSAPRGSIEDLVSRKDCKKYGVYLLLSDQLVYVGQARDLERRTRQHLTDKDWWSQVILMTTDDDSFNGSDIDYLESRLIGIASKAGTLDTDNKKRGNPQKVDEFRQAELEQYLEEALFILELIGIKALKNTKNENRKHRSKKKTISQTQKDSAQKDSVQLETSFSNSGELQFSTSEMDVLHLAGRIPARAKQCDGFWVLKGSGFSDETKPSCPSSIVDMRNKLLREEKIKDGKFTVDVRFDSPSSAASCIKGISVNGLIVWLDENGKNLKDKS